MNRNLSRKLVQPILVEMREMSAERLIDRLWCEGLLDVGALERRAIRREVDRRVRMGEGRCRAMDSVAYEYCCSYEKVREIVYNKRKR